jgi:hypothetical protein
MRLRGLLFWMIAVAHIAASRRADHANRVSVMRVVAGGVREFVDWQEFRKATPQVLLLLMDESCQSSQMNKDVMVLSNGGTIMGSVNCDKGAGVVFPRRQRSDHFSGFLWLQVAPTIQNFAERSLERQVPF